MSYKIKLDLSKCSRARICQHVAPKVFKIMGGEPVLLTSESLSATLLAEAENAADLCPMQAIELLADENS